MKKELLINGKNYSLELQGNETLLEVLRDRLGLTGTKQACDEGECGACTVMINGKSVLSCITLACDVEGEVSTIEGLAEGDNMHPLQEAFLEEGAVQCGFCSPGMIMASLALLKNNPNPDKKEIKQALDGNICRCAGYAEIFEAVKKAAEKIQQTS